MSIVVVALVAAGALTFFLRPSAAAVKAEALPKPVQKKSEEAEKVDAVKSFAALQVVAAKLRETYDEEKVRALIDPIVPLLMHKK